MSPEDRAAYGDAYAVAVRRVPKREVINHVVWRDGLLTATHGLASRPAESVAPQIGGRGVQVELFE